MIIKEDTGSSRTSNPTTFISELSQNTEKLLHVQFVSVTDIFSGQDNFGIVDIEGTADRQRDYNI